MQTLKQIIPVLDTNAYSTGEVLFDWVAIGGFGKNGGPVTLTCVHVIDKDDQKVAFDLVFANSNAVSLGPVNGNPNISDVGAEKIAGLPLAITTYSDLGGVAVAGLEGLAKLLQPGIDGKLYVAGIARGAPTHTASGLIIRIGLKAG